jgi:hypothetical protein
MVALPLAPGVPPPDGPLGLGESDDEHAIASDSPLKPKTQPKFLMRGMICATFPYNSAETCASRIKRHEALAAKCFPMALS